MDPEVSQAADAMALPGAGASASSGAARSAASPISPHTVEAPAAPPVPNPEDVRDTDMKYFHTFFQTVPKEPDKFRKVRGLADALLGKVELHAMRQGDGEVSVVMKKMKIDKVQGCRDRSVNGRTEGTGEDALTEIGTLIHLSRQASCESILRLVGCFHDERHIYLATEFCDSELFNLVQDAGAAFSEDRVKCFMHQLLKAVRHLHAHNIGHRDISLENILVKDNTKLKLMDFGQAVLARAADGRRFRYFRIIGKPYYRAPEVYTPTGKFGLVEVKRPEGPVGACVQVQPVNGYLYQVRLPEGQPEGLCRCELAGYEVEPLDMFAVGVCMFIMQWRLPPWRNALLNDGCFKFILEKGPARLIRAWREQQPSMSELSPDGMILLEALLKTNPAHRCTLERALESAWLPGEANAHGADANGPRGHDVTELSAAMGGLSVGP